MLKPTKVQSRPLRRWFFQGLDLASRNVLTLLLIVLVENLISMLLVEGMGKIVPSLPVAMFPVISVLLQTLGVATSVFVLGSLIESAAHLDKPNTPVFNGFLSFWRHKWFGALGLLPTGLFLTVSWLILNCVEKFSHIGASHSAFEHFKLTGWEKSTSLPRYVLGMITYPSSWALLTLATYYPLSSGWLAIPLNLFLNLSPKEARHAARPTIQPAENILALRHLYIITVFTFLIPEVFHITVVDPVIEICVASMLFVAFREIFLGCGENQRQECASSQLKSATAPS